MELFHASHEEITEITNTGMFGGVFATIDEGAAMSHANELHVIEIEESAHLTDFILNYKLENAYEAALEVSRNDKEMAECIMKSSCPIPASLVVPGCELSEIGWQVQYLRGQLAVRLGYKSIEMEDEHGITALCLPGCSIKKI